ncbi:OmpA family protein [Sulfuricurvum sp.]|uniref:OmpA family protein n=1 Tax=Sulfuricurvum sp. TaxID=2025608 RepID=UPI00286E297C|nr:OmpA family protein [Sulfuricurvum sp.]
MQTKMAVGLLGLWLSWSSVSADVSEMIFYPQADFSEGIFHFNYQGEKNKNYGFMFEKGFDSNRIVYVRPASHSIEKTKEGMTKLSFANTDRYSYLQRALRDDFLVSDENGIVKILLSGGDCKGSPDCVTAENILTVNVPKGYGVRKYQGLDQDLKPLKNPLWQRKGNTYTLTAHDVKGACVMMELEKLKPGQSAVSVAMAEPMKPISKAEKVEAIQPIKEVPAVSIAAEIKTEAKPKVEAAAAAVEKLIPEKQVASSLSPAPYFRNFQLFESRVVALSEVGKERLREWAKSFKAGNYKSVAINGYTDNIPPQRLKAQYATNIILSQARAKIVADYLMTLGIDSSIMSVNGMGDANPVASNENEEGRSKNRRIEFILN